MDSTRDYRKKSYVGPSFYYYEEKIIGNGSFGTVYCGKNSKTKEHIAIKKESQSNHQLQYETRYLRELQGIKGIPKIFYFHKEDKVKYLVMELLGNSLEKLRQLCGGSFTIQTTILISHQIFSLLENIHKNNIIHRDMKPDNFVIGMGKNNSTIYLIDYGLSKPYRNKITGEHIPYRGGKDLTGTARYCSIWTHLGQEQSRRDDLEGAIYVLVYLHKGKLPWQRKQLGVTKKERYDKIKEIKMITKEEELCEDMPKMFEDILKYIKTIEFDQAPNYKYIIGLIERTMKDLNINEKYVVDWIQNDCQLESMLDVNTVVEKKEDDDDDDDLKVYQ